MCPLFSMAQKTHTVGPKETLFSIGRQYNVHPRELASFNNIAFETGLTIGQVLKIPGKTTMAPLPKAEAGTPVVVKQETKKEEVKKVEVKTTPKPVIQEENAFAKEAIYHKVQKKETLYQISRMYNKVPVADIKKWNKLSSDALSEGMNLVVGYKKASTATAAVKEAPKAVLAPVADTKPVQEPVVVKEEIKTTPIPAKEPVAETRPTEAAPKTVQVKPVESNPDPVTGKNFNGGYFKAQYTASSKEENGAAGVFKSTSGWEDGRYYCLHNTAAAGTIVKITSATTQKSVYAKVLDVIPDLKKNQGVQITVSNAAAHALGESNERFEVSIQY